MWELLLAGKVRVHITFIAVSLILQAKCKVILIFVISFIIYALKLQCESHAGPHFAIHSGQTTGHSREHARDLSTSGQFPSSSHKIPRSTSATQAISVLSSLILPPQTFFSRVLLLRQQPFSSENLPPERPTTTIAIKTQVFMFRYESVNSTRKFTIVAEIVSLLKKIYKRDAHFRAVFKVKTLAVLVLAYPHEMKHIPRNLNLPPFWRCLFLWKWCNPFPRARARLKHAHSFDRCGTSQ